MSEVKAVARMAVEFVIDAESLRGAEKLLDQWLSSAKDDDRLIEYRVNWSKTDWEPRS